MPSLADSHVHLDDSRFDADRRDVVGRAHDAGIHVQIVPSVARSGWPDVAALAGEHEGVHGAYGLHPMFLASHKDSDIHALSDWLDGHAAVAVGEIGLDHFVEGLDRDRQERLFHAQLAIALERDLPVIVHARRAVEPVMLALRRHKGIRGVIHSFAGSEEQVRQLVDLGFHFGIGGPVTYPGAHRLHRVVSVIPLDHLLLETDSPDQPSVDHRGERNEPAWLTSVLRHVARLRGEPEEQIAEATTSNVRRLFRLDR